jgi:hypothetical protein
MNMQVTKTQAMDKLQEIESALQSIAFYIGQQDNAQQETYITAAQARELGAGNFEALCEDGKWRIGTQDCPYREMWHCEVVKYRAIKQSHPDDSKIRVGDKVRIGVYVCGEFKPMGLAIVVEDVDAHLCKVDKMSLHGGAPWITLEQKSHLRKEPKAEPEPVDQHAALRAEYAKQVKEGTVGFYLWEFKNKYMTKFAGVSECFEWHEFHPMLEYRCTDISCYVSKDDEPAIRMLRTEAQELQRKTEDTHDWRDPRGADWVHWAFGGEGTYTYRTKALKQVKWKDVPVGAAVQDNATNVVWLLQGVGDGIDVLLANHPKNLFGMRWTDTSCIKLAPASEQPWIPTIAPHEGLVVEYSKFSECMKITGIAKGYVMEGAV